MTNDPTESTDESKELVNPATIVSSDKIRRRFIPGNICFCFLQSCLFVNIYMVLINRISLIDRMRNYEYKMQKFIVNVSKIRQRQLICLTTQNFKSQFRSALQFPFSQLSQHSTNGEFPLSLSKGMDNPFVNMPEVIFHMYSYLNN